MDKSAHLPTAFSCTSAIGFVVLDEKLRFQVVNRAVSDMHGIPAEAFVANALHDILGDAASEPEARLKRTLITGETQPVEVSVMLPLRAELGYWIEKNFPIKGRSGKTMQIASIAVEVTANRKLEERFCKLAGQQLWQNEGYRRLARDLRESIDSYHIALGRTLDRLSRCSRDPERIPELLTQPAEFLDPPMQKLASAVARCFPLDQHH
jgi:hypothetical protein